MVVIKSRDRIDAHAGGGEARGDGGKEADRFQRGVDVSVIIRQRNEAASPMVCAASSVTIRVVPSRSRNTITGSRPSGRGTPGFSVAKT